MKNKVIIAILDNETVWGDVYQTLRLPLLAEGYRVITAKTVPDIYKIASKENTAFVILHLCQSKFNGDMIVRLLRKEKSTKYLPVITLLPCENYKQVPGSSYMRCLISVTTNLMGVLRLINIVV